MRSRVVARDDDKKQKTYPNYPSNKNTLNRSTLMCYLWQDLNKVINN
ncbi:MAG: hypothetical protein JWO09_553 [Bacteroidetes bacterium]|nr:hypothetical protein [Bacteroidota bacterium]